MADRDRLERLVRGWHDFEKKAGSSAVIDFDCAPDVVGDDVQDRFEVLDRLAAMRSEVHADDVGAVLDAHLAYLRALLGERLDLTEYVDLTQGSPTNGWSPDYVAAVGEQARRALADVDVAWDEQTRTAFDALSPTCLLYTSDAADE